MMDSEDPNIQRILGVEGDMGAKVGLPNDFMVKVIKAVGNYGEIYDRNLGPATPFSLPRGQNSLYTQGGLMYAPPIPLTPHHHRFGARILGPKSVYSPDEGDRHFAPLPVSFIRGKPASRFDI